VVDGFSKIPGLTPLLFPVQKGLDCCELEQILFKRILSNSLLTPLGKISGLNVHKKGRANLTLPLFLIVLVVTFLISI
jgi:hypothetical protein